jgi:pyrroline-5-carboxylate reductase
LAAEVCGEVVASPQDLARDADIVVLATKPGDVAAVLESIDWPDTQKILVSMAAGVRTQTLVSSVPESVEVVRVMPNVAAVVGAGVTGVLRHPDERIMEKVVALFEACGEVVVLEKEKNFGPLTAISGSGPAYLFVAIEALADGGVMMGLTREMALKLAVHTVHGAALLAMEQDHPAALKDKVASPGGTTIHGLAALERRGFRAALIDAVQAASDRSEALGANKKNKVDTD